MFCSKCGAQIQDGAKFCPKCGNAFAAPVTQPNVSQPVVQQTVAQQPTAQAAPQQQAPQQATAQAAPQQQAPQQAAASQQQAMPQNAAPANFDYGQPKKKGIPAVAIIGVAAVVVIAVAVFAFTHLFGGGSSGGYGSSDAAISALEADFNGVFDGMANGKTEESVTTLCTTIIDGMHPKLIDEAMDEGGFDSKDDLIEEIEDGMGLNSSSLSYTESIMEEVADVAEWDLTLKAGDALSSSEIESYNEQLDDYDLDIKITAGYEVVADMDLTFTDDWSYYSKGDTETLASDDSIDLYVVEIDGRWYYMPSL